MLGNNNLNIGKLKFYFSNQDVSIEFRQVIEDAFPWN